VPQGTVSLELFEHGIDQDRLTALFVGEQVRVGRRLGIEQLATLMRAEEAAKAGAALLPVFWKKSVKIESARSGLSPDQE
jgi:hypothetical protein